MKPILAILAVVWALPWTLFGLAIGLGSLLRGGTVRRRGRVLEFSGAGPAWFLRTFPLVGNAAAVTFGHTIVARSEAVLVQCRPHELVHVRQYERWGFFFVPAYLVCWAFLWLRGKSGYFDNPFERQAYDEAG